MGFDIRLVAAVNVNDFLVRCLRHGTMSTGQAVTPTLAPAMDIQAPYNVERLLFLATDGDAAAVRSMMTQLEERGRASLPAAVVEALRRVVVDTHCVDDGRIVDVMRRCQRDYGYTVCPHSATALAYHFHVCDRARQEGAATPAPPAVLLLTASAAKFPEACAAAGVPTPGHRFLDALVGRPNRVRGTFAAGHDWTQLLKKVIERL